MASIRREKTFEPLQLIAVRNPASPLPAGNGWDAARGDFDWPLVEANFHFVTMGRVTSGDAQFFMQPLPLSQLGYQPHPLARGLHDLLWELRGIIQRNRGRARPTGNELRVLAELKEKITAQRRLIWQATFGPASVATPQVEQLRLL